MLTQMGIPPKTAALYIEMYKAINAGVLARAGAAFAGEQHADFV